MIGLPNTPAGLLRAADRSRGNAPRKGAADQQRSAEQRKKIRAELEAKDRSKRQIFALQQELLEPSASEELLAAARKLLQPDDYHSVVEERALGELCGYPGCGNSIRPPPQGLKYVVNVKAAELIPSEAMALYCCKDCRTRSGALAVSLQPDPAYMRSTTSSSTPVVSSAPVQPRTAAESALQEELRQLTREPQPLQDLAAPAPQQEQEQDKVSKRDSKPKLTAPVQAKKPLDKLVQKQVQERQPEPSLDLRSLEREQEGEQQLGQDHQLPHCPNSESSPSGMAPAGVAAAAAAAQVAQTTEAAAPPSSPPPTPPPPSPPLDPAAKSFKEDMASFFEQWKDPDDDGSLGQNWLEGADSASFFDKSAAQGIIAGSPWQGSPFLKVWGILSSWLTNVALEVIGKGTHPPPLDEDSKPAERTRRDVLTELLLDRVPPDLAFLGRRLQLATLSFALHHPLPSISETLIWNLLAALLLRSILRSDVARGALEVDPFHDELMESQISMAAKDLDLSSQELDMLEELLPPLAQSGFGDGPDQAYAAKAEAKAKAKAEAEILARTELETEAEAEARAETLRVFYEATGALEEEEKEEKKEKEEKEKKEKKERKQGKERKTERQCMEDEEVGEALRASDVSRGASASTEATDQRYLLSELD